MVERPALWILVALSAFLILVVANFLYLSVLKDHKTYIVSAITSSYPFFTVIAGFLLFHEMISITHFIGIVMISGGVFALTT
jgi:drug/metabolite transporter (DMT)-like permease